MGIDLSFIYNLFGMLPFDWLKPLFMQRALLAVLLLCPMTAMLGCHTLNFRMAFFSDAVGHSAFAGLAFGVLLGFAPQATVLVFGIIIGIAIMAVQRKSGLSADAAIGMVFSAVVAFGLAIVSREPGLSREIQQYIYGDILTVADGEIAILAILFLCLIIFEFFGWNKLLAMALSTSLAKVDGIATGFWQYLFAAILALVVMYSVRMVGVLLVTALLITPAASASKLGRDMRGFFWWAIIISTTSGIAGLALSAQDWLATASGATIILVACLWFAASCLWRAWRK